jgi:hypothetical protein
VPPITVTTLIAVPRPATSDDGSLDGGMSICPLKAMTGLDCPLCGATRATFSLLQGHVSTAVDHNALYVASLPVLATLGLLWVVFRWRPPAFDQAWFRWVVVGVAVAFAVVRNLPMEPFTFLGSSAGRQ